MTDTFVEDAKARLRETAVDQRAKLGAGIRAEAAAAAAEHFFTEIALGPEQVVAAYWPIRDEIDCKPVLSRLMDGGQPVCLPVIMGQGKPLVFRRWEPGAALYESGFGTLAPPETAPVDEPDVIIIPLLGFDRSGMRLGYGRAYYDITIASMSKSPKLIGYAFAAQELESIPAEEHDVLLDYLVTENGVRKFY